MGSGIPGSRDPLGGHIVGHAEFMGQKYSRKMDPQPLYPLIVFQNLETEECTLNIKFSYMYYTDPTSSRANIHVKFLIYIML